MSIKRCVDKLVSKVYRKDSHTETANSFKNVFAFLLFQNLIEHPGKPISFNEKYKHFIYLLTHIFWICNNQHLEHYSNKIFDLLNSDAFQTRKFTSGQIINLKTIIVLSMLQHWIKPWEKGEPPSFSMHPNFITPLSA